MELALIPSGVMLAGSIFTVLLPEPPPKMIAHALQHLAAGIVLCAISTELVSSVLVVKGGHADVWISDSTPITS